MINQKRMSTTSKNENEYSKYIFKFGDMLLGKVFL